MEPMMNLFAQYGLLLVFANVLLAQAGLPLPALPTLIVAGALAFAVLGLAVGLYIVAKLIERRLFIRLIRLMRMVRITAHELRALKQRETPVVILDVRSSIARKIDPRHIPGALAVNIATPAHDISNVSPAC